MLIEVIYDMGIFLFILLITLCAFGDAFLRIDLANDNGNNFIQTPDDSFVPAVIFAYSMILGNFSTTFGDVAVPLVFIFWILCTLLDMIVMLNLLITIIANTYGRVADNQEQASYQEMAALIFEN